MMVTRANGERGERKRRERERESEHEFKCMLNLI